MLVFVLFRFDATFNRHGPLLGARKCKPPDNGSEWVIYRVGSLCLSFTPYDIEKTTNGMLRFLYFNYT